MVWAVGVDLVEIPRVRRLLGRERALKRLFTEAELAYAFRHRDPAPSLAARLAAKEAFQKCWPEPLSWQAVWVEMEGKRPFLAFRADLRERLAALGLRVHLSLSHERGLAIALVVVERAEPHGVSDRGELEP